MTPVQPQHMPKHVTTDTSAPLCMSTDNFASNMPGKLDAEFNQYNCNYPFSYTDHTAATALSREGNGKLRQEALQQHKRDKKQQYVANRTSSLSAQRKMNQMEHIKDRSGCELPDDDDLRTLVSECLAAPADTRVEGPTKRVYLVGDSHALNLVPSLAAAVHGDAVLRVLTATGRGFLHPDIDVQSDTFQTGECDKDMTGSTAKYREAVVAALDASVMEGDVVVIHNFWKDAEEEKKHAAYYESDLVEKILAPRKAHLMVFSDWTRLQCDSRGHLCAKGGFDAAVPERAKACFADHDWMECASVAKPVSLRNVAFQELQTRHPESVTFMDLYQLYVDSSNLISINIPGTNLIWQGTDKYQVYSTMEPDKQMAFDGGGFNSHQSLSGSFYLWPFLCDQLMELDPAAAAASEVVAPAAAEVAAPAAAEVAAPAAAEVVAPAAAEVVAPAAIGLQQLDEKIAQAEQDAVKAGEEVTKAAAEVQKAKEKEQAERAKAEEKEKVAEDLRLLRPAASSRHSVKYGHHHSQTLKESP